MVLNVTATKPTEPTFFTVWPTGHRAAGASNLNFIAGQTVPNMVIATVGDDGKVCLFSQNGTHLVANINAWWDGRGERTAAVTGGPGIGQGGGGDPAGSATVSGSPTPGRDIVGGPLAVGVVDDASFVAPAPPLTRPVERRASTPAR